MKPSNALILNLLRVHPEGITSYMALQEARCLRLAARISDLRAEGHNITSDLIPVSHGKHVSLYRLRDYPHLTLDERLRANRADVLEANRWTPEELVTVASQSGMDVSHG